MRRLAKGYLGTAAGEEGWGGATEQTMYVDKKLMAEGVAGARLMIN